MDPYRRIPERWTDPRLASLWVDPHSGALRTADASRDAVIESQSSASTVRAQTDAVVTGFEQYDLDALRLLLSRYREELEHHRQGGMEDHPELERSIAQLTLELERKIAAESAPLESPAGTPVDHLDLDVPANPNAPGWHHDLESAPSPVLDVPGNPSAPSYYDHYR